VGLAPRRGETRSADSAALRAISGARNSTFFSADIGFAKELRAIRVAVSDSAIYIGILALSLAVSKELASKGGYALILENPNSPLLAIGVSPDCSLRRRSETAGGHLAAAGHQ
jgi:hypothetical protein